MRFPDQLHYLVRVRLGFVIDDGPQRNELSCRKVKESWLCTAQQHDLDDHVGLFEPRDFAATDRNMYRAIMMGQCWDKLKPHAALCCQAEHNGAGCLGVIGLNLFAHTTSAHSPVRTLQLVS